MSGFYKIFIRWLPVLLLMALILLMSATPGDQAGRIFKRFTGPLRSALRESGVLAFLTRPDWYKVGHVIAYGILGAVLYNTLRQSTARPLLWSLLIVVAFACLDELVQFFVPGRSAAFSDVLLDTAAALVVMLGGKVLTSSPKLKGDPLTDDGGQRSG
jgi:VanZ family protein